MKRIIMILMLILLVTTGCNNSYQTCKTDCLINGFDDKDYGTSIGLSDDKYYLGNETYTRRQAVQYCIRLCSGVK